ncbi:MAG TPA: hypothetical protein PKL92_00685 [Aquaticitalea sp.]|nr:hypothetical protein [Aquaticitalea sp.]
MGLHKILRIVAAVLSVLGIVFLIRIIAKGDEAIKVASLTGDTEIIDPMAWVTYIIFAITVAFVLFFVLKNLFTDTSSLKNTLIGVGAFLLVLLIAYFVSGGDTTIYKYNGAAVTAGESQMVGAGLVAFYILMVVAALSMVVTGVKKMIS